MLSLFYDSTSCGNGKFPMTRELATFPIQLSRLNVKYNVKIIGDTVNSKFNLYLIELFRIDLDIEEIFKNIPIETIDFIKLNNIKILVYYPYEGMDLSLYDNWFAKLHQLFLKYNMHNIKKYFIYNNLNIDNYYKIFLNDNKHLANARFSKVFGYCFFHSDSYFNIIKNKIQLNNNPREKTKDFVCYNSQIRPHRIFLISELIRRNLVEHNYVSMIGAAHNFPGTDLRYASSIIEEVFLQLDLDQVIVDHCRNYIANWKPMYLDKIADTVDNISFDIAHYQDTYFSVVTETGMGYPLRMTEKVFKPISNQHPFIVFGCQGTLKYLKSIGYQTFPEMFDESYDNIDNIYDRILAAILEIEKFNQLPADEKKRRFSSVLPTLKHNQHVFLEEYYTKHQQELITILQEIAND
jgi:hypothetical protein